MYFWRIRSLKDDLEVGAIAEKEALPYLLWLGGLTTFSSMLSFGENNSWDTAGAFSSAGLFVAGTIHAYRSNGGSAGSAFFIRYISISWVIGLRLAVLMVVPGVILLVGLEELLLGDIPEETTIVGFVGALAFEVAYYWRLAVHVRDVAEHMRAA